MARRLNIEVEQSTAGTPDHRSAVEHVVCLAEGVDVPVAELLVEAGDSLVSPVLERSQLVRLMKTVLAVREQAKQESIRRMAQTMFDQFIGFRDRAGTGHSPALRRRAWSPRLRTPPAGEVSVRPKSLTGGTSRPSSK